MKNIWKFIGSLVLLMSAVRLSQAACGPTDMWCYQSGSYVSPTQVGKLDASGNLTINGNLTTTGTGSNTSSGKTVYVPTSQVNISTLVPVAITATNMVIKSTAGIVTFYQVGRLPSEGPAISTATATSGQYLILHSTTSVDTVVITTGTATGVLSGSDATITISAAKPAISLIYDSTLSAWIVIGKQ